MLKGVKGEKTFATYSRTAVERSFTKANIEGSNPATVLEENDYFASFG
jgi:hypothetical protein